MVFKTLADIVLWVPSVVARLSGRNAPEERILPDDPLQTLMTTCFGVWELSHNRRQFHRRYYYDAPGVVFNDTTPHPDANQNVRYWEAFVRYEDEQVVYHDVDDRRSYDRDP